MQGILSLAARDPRPIRAEPASQLVTTAMTEIEHPQTLASPGIAQREVRALARQAIHVMATRSRVPTALSDQRMKVLCEAFLSEQEDPRHLALLRLRQDGISLRSIVDHVVPDIARHLGLLWASDEISFAEVTIGTARLQETVRTLAVKDHAWAIVTGQPDAADEMRDAGSPAPERQARRVLMVIPRPEHHTLGVFVASDQFRRRGFDVDIAIDRHPRQIASMARLKRYDMIGITVAGRKTLASAREIIDMVRPNLTRVTPIVLGGSFAGSGADLRRVTGADYIAEDVTSAVAQCGLHAEPVPAGFAAETGRR